MRLTEVTSSSGVTVPGMVDMIMRKCHPYVRIMGWDSFLFRGIHPATVDFSINACPVNRKPKDTPDFFHKIADDWFKSEFGIRYRSNAVFATGSHNIAESYGTPYAVFPCGKFRFCWSVDVADMTKEFKFLMTMAMNDKDEGVDRMTKGLASVKYQESDLPYATESGNEIMIHCDEYIMVNVEDGTLERLVKYIHDENTRNINRATP